MSDAIELKEVRQAEYSAPALMPAMTIEQMVARHKALVEATQKVLRKGIDYGEIGESGRPTLLKPGAEKLAALFGLRPRIEIIEKIEDWEGGFFYYLYRCRLYRNGEVVAEADGSANSREKKHRWRMVPEWKYDPSMGEPVRWETRTGRGGKPYKVAIYENREPYDLVNTLQKMAQKRALVAAVLIATGASEFFTQDLEDLEVDPDGVPSQQTASNQQGNAKRADGGHKQTKAHASNGITPAQLAKLNATLNELGLVNGKYRNEKLRLAEMIAGRELKSSKELTKGEASKFIDYLEKLKGALAQAGVKDKAESANYIAFSVEAGALPPTDVEALKADLESFRAFNGDGREELFEGA